MNRMKPNKQQYVDFIINELIKGNVSYSDVSLVFFSKFKLSVPTFAKYWKIANETHRATQKEAQQAIKDITIETAVEGAKQGLKSKLEFVLEIQKMLDDDIYEESVLDLKTGRVTRFHRKLTPLERKALYERISKFEGMDAPTKVAQTTVAGDDLQPITLSNLTDDELRTLAELQRKSGIS